MLLTKAGGVSRFVYPIVSLYKKLGIIVKELVHKLCMENRNQYLKKDIFSLQRAGGGLEVLLFTPDNIF